MNNTPGSNDSESLQYFLSVKETVAVVSFAGRLSRDNEPMLMQCQTDLVAKQPKFVVLYLRDIANRVELAALPSLARLQKAIREIPADLRICSPHPEFRRLLEDKGLLRPNELSANLLEALQSTPIAMQKS